MARTPDGHAPPFHVVDTRKVYGVTADAVVAVDAEQRIVGWNRAATDLLGHRPEEALGRRCDEILALCDRCGDEVCDTHCPSPAAAQRGEVLPTREVIGRSSTGRRVWLSVSTVVPPPATADGVALVHVLREVGLPPELERLVAERLRGNGSSGDQCEGHEVLGRLTSRERQVLRLLADGADTDAIAQELVITPATVRNHVQNILGKLEVHSRLEAVALFLRHER